MLDQVMICVRYFSTTPKHGDGSGEGLKRSCAIEVNLLERAGRSKVDLV